jgi:hypothetical protein
MPGYGSDLSVAFQTICSLKGSNGLVSADSELAVHRSGIESKRDKTSLSPRDCRTLGAEPQGRLGEIGKTRSKRQRRVTPGVRKTSSCCAPFSVYSSGTHKVPHGNRVEDGNTIMRHNAPGTLQDAGPTKQKGETHLSLPSLVVC